MGLYLAHIPWMVTGEPDAQTKETIWDLRFPKPPVEPIDEFVDVLLEPVRLHGTVRGMNRQAFEGKEGIGVTDGVRVQIVLDGE